MALQSLIYFVIDYEICWMMNVSRTPELEALVHAKLATGMYNNASEVIREALRLLKDHRLLNALRTQQLKQALSIGLSGLDRGEHCQESLEDIRRNLGYAKGEV